MAQQQGVKRERPDESEAIKDPRALIKQLSMEQKVVILACLIPNGDCPYFASRTGTAAEPCLRCGCSAREHGNLVNPAMIEQQFVTLLGYAAKLEAQLRTQKTYPPGICVSTLLALLDPVPAAELGAQVPFETPTIDDILRQFVHRYSKTPTAGGEALKDAGRKACALVMRMLGEGIGGGAELLFRPC